MTINEYFRFRKEAFVRLKGAAPGRSVTMTALLGEIANLLRERSPPAPRA